MIWAKLNRLVNSAVLAIAMVGAATGGIYYMGYPWNCHQALENRNEANLRLQLARSGNYPPGSPYRQYRESEKREADALAESKCESQSSRTTPDRGTPKFFLKDLSDY